MDRLLNGSSSLESAAPIPSLYFVMMTEPGLTVFPWSGMREL